MVTIPEFPNFKPITIEDRKIIHPILSAYKPVTSELTFVNLYIWREYYQFHWTMLGEQLIVFNQREDRSFVLPPVGPGDRVETVYTVLKWLETNGRGRAGIERADKRLVSELGDRDDLVIEATRDHFDYVYLAENLGTLAGRKYSKKRNHINQFLREYAYTYAPLTPDLTKSCLDLAEVWCEQRMCEEDISLQHEFCGIKDAFEHVEELEMEGGVIIVDDKVQAFALGERLNDETAVIHIEKANPNYHGIYPMMTREFPAQRWMGEVTYINREQDIGDPGLRRAKESYYPEHLEEKWTIHTKA